MGMFSILESSLAATTVTLIMSWLLSHFRNRKHSRGETEGVLLEILISQQYAKAYLQSTDHEERDFWAPAYRAPLDFAERALSHLQSEGLLKADGLQPCINWMLAVREFNRCLEFAAGAVARHGNDDDARIHGMKETKRLKLKSQHVVDLGDAAAKIIGKVLRSWRVRRLLHKPEAL